jgi:hypothetical protein
MSLANDRLSGLSRAICDRALSADAREVRTAGAAVAALLAEQRQDTLAVGGRDAAGAAVACVRHALAKRVVEVVAADAELGLDTAGIDGGIAVGQALAKSAVEVIARHAQDVVDAGSVDCGSVDCGGIDVGQALAKSAVEVIARHAQDIVDAGSVDAAGIDVGHALTKSGVEGIADDTQLVLHTGAVEGGPAVRRRFGRAGIHARLGRMAAVEAAVVT